MPCGYMCAFFMFANIASTFIYWLKNIWYLVLDKDLWRNGQNTQSGRI